MAGDNSSTTGTQELPLCTRSQPKVTPRRSPPDLSKNEAATDQQTPAVLRAPALLTSATRLPFRTPGPQPLDFRSSRQLLSEPGRKGVALLTQFTPHGRAAMRALDSRRAAINEINTPGRKRRRSVRDQRETPRDILRALSRTLAPNSKAITSSSSSPPDDPTHRSKRDRSRRGRSRSRRGERFALPEEDPDDSDDFPIDRPRLSLPIDEDDISDDDLRPPRSSGLEELDDNFTMQSIEVARRQTLDQQQQYSMRLSDVAPFNDPTSDDGGIAFDSALFSPVDWNNNARDGDHTGLSAVADSDAALERLDDDDVSARRESFGAIEVNLDQPDQSTIVLQPHVQSSPRRETFSSPRNQPPFGVDNPTLTHEMDIDDDTSQNPLNELGAGHDDAHAQTDDRTSDQDAPTTVKQTSKSIPTSKRSKGARAGKKISKFSIEYPSLPPGVVTRIAQRFLGGSKMSSDTRLALIQASDWFFEQLGDDLSAYAKHAGRKTIEESDMLTLMKRQRLVNSTTTAFALAQRHLPRELLQELRLLPPAFTKAKKRPRLAGGNPTRDQDATT